MKHKTNLHVYNPLGFKTLSRKLRDRQQKKLKGQSLLIVSEHKTRSQENCQTTELFGLQVLQMTWTQDMNFVT